MELTYNVTGFLKDAAYTAELLNLLRKYEPDFPELNSIKIQLEDVPFSRLGSYSPKPIVFMNENKDLVITSIQSPSYDKKNKPYSWPTATGVYLDLHFLFEKALEQYKILYPDSL